MIFQKTINGEFVRIELEESFSALLFGQLLLLSCLLLIRSSMLMSILKLFLMSQFPTPHLNRQILIPILSILSIQIQLLINRMNLKIMSGTNLMMKCLTKDQISQSLQIFLMLLHGFTTISNLEAQFLVSSNFNQMVIPELYRTTFVKNWSISVTRMKQFSFT